MYEATFNESKGEIYVWRYEMSSSIIVLLNRKYLISIAK